MANIYDIEFLNSIMNPKTPKLGLEPLYPNFGAPMPMEEPDIAPEYGLNLIGNDLPYLKELTPTTDMGATGITPQLAQGIITQFDPERFQNMFPTSNIRQLAPLDMNRFQGVSNMSIIDETTNDEQDQEYIDLVEKPNNKFGGLMDLIGNIAIPGYGFFKSMAKGGLEGLRGFNNRIQGSDFGRSKTLVDYLDAKKYGGIDARDRAASKNMREARAIQRQVDMRGDSTSRVADRNRSSVTTSSAARSKGVGGGGYTASDSNRESYRGR